MLDRRFFLERGKGIRWAFRARRFDTFLFIFLFFSCERKLCWLFIIVAPVRVNPIYLKNEQNHVSFERAIYLNIGMGMYTLIIDINDKIHHKIGIVDYFFMCIKILIKFILLSISGWVQDVVYRIWVGYNHTHAVLQFHNIYSLRQTHWSDIE